jgi:hypothetical protein
MPIDRLPSHLNKLQNDPGGSDMLDKVSACIFDIWRTGWLTLTQTSASCWTGPASAITSDPALLQSNGDPSLSW